MKTTILYTIFLLLHTLSLGAMMLLTYWRIAGLSDGLLNADQAMGKKRRTMTNHRE